MLPARPPMLEQRPLKPGRVLEPDLEGPDMRLVSQHESPVIMLIRGHQRYY